MDGRATVSGTFCGLISATAIGVVLASLGEYQVPDFADEDGTIGVAYGLVATVVAVFLVAATRPTPQLQVAVPLVLVPLAIVPLVTGGERNRLEAFVIWGAAACAVHLLIAYRKKSSVAVVLAAVLLTWGCQERWRAQKFEAVGLPLAVPEISGHRLTGTWAGRYSVSMTLRGPAGRTVHAVITRDAAPGASAVPLRDGAVMVLVPGQGPVSVRYVDGAEFARHPDDRAMAEPD
jgi:Flp pilus assembly pilin Flp